MFAKYSVYTVSTPYTYKYVAWKHKNRKAILEFILYMYLHVLNELNSVTKYFTIFTEINEETQGANK